MTEDEANIPLGNLGAKFTKKQFITYARLAQEYLCHRSDADQKDTRPNVSRRQREEIEKLNALFERPVVKDRPTSVERGNDALDFANAEEAAGTSIDQHKAMEVRQRLERARQKARERGQTGRRGLPNN